MKVLTVFFAIGLIAMTLPVAAQEEADTGAVLSTENIATDADGYDWVGYTYEQKVILMAKVFNELGVVGRFKAEFAVDALDRYYLKQVKLYNPPESVRKRILKKRCKDIIKEMVDQKMGRF